MWKLFRRVRSRRKRGARATAQYLAHKEAARAFVHARLTVLNSSYGFAYEKVAIRDQRSRWGSCSAKGNLNFNYRVIFLTPELADYIIVHELCHLGEFNHAAAFWKLVEREVPEFNQRRRELRRISMKTLKAPLVPAQIVV